ncbi:MAG: amidase, partial [Sulfurospirillaceae bacterium]|nr:amidase [Sulfurospirillaceae bacterium]
MNSLTHYDATKLISLMKNKEVSPLEVCEAFLKEIAKKDEQLHAWEYIDKTAIERQINKINTLDANTHPLWGLPIGIKDNYNTFDMPTQMGSPIWKGFTPGNDSRVVHYLRRNGAIILGKTTTAEFAVHYQDKTRNPHDLERSPGTSSSGSAVAVASDMAPVAFGSQTAGSISRPASYCGVYGYKPTFGVLARVGVLKTTDTLDTLGFLTKSARDLRLILDASRVHGRNYEYVHKYLDNHPKTPKKSFKIGIIKHPKWHLVDSFAKKAFEMFVQKLDSKFLHVQEVKPPKEMERVHDIHGVIYDKTLSYYFREEFKQGTLISPIFHDIMTSGNKITLEQYKQALLEQTRLSLEAEEYFKDFDVLLTLTTADEAPIGLTTPDTPDSNLIWTFYG